MRLTSHSKPKERIKYDKWLKENYPETYSLRETEAIKQYVEFGYVVWLNAKDDLSRELLRHERLE